MYDVIKSAKSPFTAEIVLKNTTMQTQQIRLIGRDAYKPYTLYSDRIVTLKDDQQRNIEMTFPISPDFMEIYTYNIAFKQVNPKTNDGTHIAQVSKTLKTIKTCDVWLDQDTADFVEFAEWFSVNAGLLSYGEYRSRNGKFIIVYLPYLTFIEKYTKIEKKSTSPSRIGHKTGRIEVSKEHFIQYSVPKRFLILMHEFMHKYGNEKFLNRDITDENGADFLGLYVYLGKGFPRIDAKDVFLNIFYANPTPENETRKNLILKYIADFDAGKINGHLNCSKPK